VFILISSFQEYMINIVRNKKNWEVQFTNIKYLDAIKIKEDINTKEISIFSKIGISEPFIDNGFFKIHLDVRAYDRNALKNENLCIIEGRLPENSREIVIAEHENMQIEGIPKNINEEIEIKINNQIKRYQIVGIVKKIDFDCAISRIASIGAITYLEDNQLNGESIVDISIITKNMQKIYENTKNIARSIGIEDKINISNENEITYEKMIENLEKYGIVLDEEKRVLFNTELLNYTCMAGEKNEFAKRLELIEILAICIITPFAIFTIYTALKITYAERMKALGMLKSIGMDKKQENSMILKEALITGTFGIIVGILLGIISSKIIINILNNYIKNIALDAETLQIINSHIDFNMKIPIYVILLSIIIIYLIVFIVNIEVCKKVNKIAIIEAIKEKESIKAKKENKLIRKIFKVEGNLAYINISRNKGIYKSIIISITISIVLFLTVSEFIINNYNIEKKKKYVDYALSFQDSGNQKEKVIQYLNENNLINSYFIKNSNYMLQLKENNITKKFKSIIQNNRGNKDIKNYEMIARYI
jgi:putative ABC transport system permease protein